MTTGTQRYLVLYSGVLTVAFVATVVAAFLRPRTARFDEIEVQRLNLRDADGTLRFVLSN